MEIKFFLYLLVGFAFLKFGSDWLIEGAEGLAERLGVPSLVIGLTVVALGTSLPEFMVSLLAGKAQAIAVGNVVGSNIANVTLVLGLAAVISPITVHKMAIWREMPVALMASLALFVMQPVLTWWKGLLLLYFFLLFVWYNYISAKRSRSPVLELDQAEDFDGRKMPLTRIFLLVVVGLVILLAGAQLTIKSAVAIAAALGVSQAIIGLFGVAVGTSLPELAVSFRAALIGHSNIALGNVLGSNIFNIFWVLGIGCLVRDLNLVPFRYDILVSAGVMGVLMLLVFRKGKISRWNGILLLVIYIVYIASKFV